MKVYSGIDLHATNIYMGIIDSKGKKIFGHKYPNYKETILNALEPYKKYMEGIVVESTFNWYWLVDTLIDSGYKVHLANPSAIQQYEGLKYSNDQRDAFWLAKMLMLGILPEGYIYPKEMRRVRDLLRQRSKLVKIKSSFKHLLQQVTVNQTGIKLTNSLINKMEEDRLIDIFEDSIWIENGRSSLRIIRTIEEEIAKIEKIVIKEIKDKWQYKGLKSVPGIGNILAATISLETGPIERFQKSSQYASYCRCVPSSYWSNEKRKGSGNKKNGNKYLSWAFAEAANLCIRYCEEAEKYYQRKCAKRKPPLAYRAITNKLSKACYYIMRDGSKFEVVRIFN